MKARYEDHSYTYKWTTYKYIQKWEKYKSLFQIFLTILKPPLVNTPTFLSIPKKCLALCHGQCFQTLKSLGPHYLKYLPKLVVVPTVMALMTMLHRLTKSNTVQTLYNLMPDQAVLNLYGDQTYFLWTWQNHFMIREQ